MRSFSASETDEETREAFAALGLPNTVAPEDLTDAQRVAIYRIYFNDAMRAARKGAERRSGRPYSAIDLLYELGDFDSAMALADTFFRLGGPQGAELIQESLNDFYETEGSSKRVLVDSKFGSKTYGAFKVIVQNPADRKILLDIIANRRTAKHPIEYRRNDHHRIP